MGSSQVHANQIVNGTVQTKPRFAMPVSAKYLCCIKILRGAFGDLIIFGWSVLASFTFFVIGCWVMGENNRDRVFNIQPVAFLVAQAFTVTTVYRDRMLKQSPVIH